VSIAEESGDRSYDGRILLRLIGYLKPHAALVAIALLLLLASASLALVGPRLTQHALDVAIPARDGGLLATLALIYVGALILEFGAEYAQALLTTSVGQRVMHALRMRLFERLQRLRIAYFDRHPVGRLMTRVTSDVETLNELFSAGLVAVFGDVFTLLAIMGMMLALDWRLALVAFAVVPLIWLVATLFRRNVRSAFRDIRVRLARINSFLQEHLSGMAVVRLFHRQAAAARAFDRLNREHLDAHLRSIRIYAIFFPVVEFLSSVALALLLWQGGLRTLEGSLTVGTLAAFIQLSRRFFQPLQDLSEKVNLLQAAMASAERIFELLDEEVEPEGKTERRKDGSPHARRDASDADTTVLPSFRPSVGAVVFDRVSFRYSPDGPWVLKDVSFTAAPGRTVALVGHTGAGKTTIISLLLRFYRPEQGRITIDGVDIQELPAQELRGLIGFVPQDLFLFSGDIRRNILLDAPLPESRAVEAAERVGAHRFIERLPSGYAHSLGERGRSLSVGERQLLSFARALALDPRILILDEATSSVDAEAEAQIQRALEELMAGRTCLVVAHRLSTILHADEILVLHHGEIRERGTHRSLLAQRGLYERLYRLQIAAGAERRTA